MADKVSELLGGNGLLGGEDDFRSREECGERESAFDEEIKKG